MSLPKDALKKAEENQRQIDAATNGSIDVPIRAVSDSALHCQPEPVLCLEPLDPEFQKASPVTLQTSADRSPARLNAKDLQNDFKAGQTPMRKAFPVVAGLAALIATTGIGAYSWRQLQPMELPKPSPATPSPAATPAPAPIAAARIAPASDAAAPSTSEARPATTSGKSPAPAAVQPAMPKPESPIRITTSKPEVHPRIASAYQAFLSGDIAMARHLYQSVLTGEPKNIDALHGLAAISLRQGRSEEMEAYYLRIIEADPKDNAAHAGLIGLQGQLDPLRSESRLKNLLAGQPDSPFLNFALGNLHAREGRWNDAHQAYFRACTADGDNPDYLFNLAVSLDQLRRTGPALHYFQKALAAATRRPAAFDKNQVAGRIRELQHY